MAIGVAGSTVQVALEKGEAMDIRIEGALRRLAPDAPLQAQV